MSVDTLDTNLLRTKRVKTESAEPPPPSAPASARRKVVKTIAYTAIFLAALLFFIYLKTPASLLQGVVLNTLNVAEAERVLIQQALEATDNNRTRAAELLGISVRTLRNKLNAPDREDEEEE